MTPDMPEVEEIEETAEEVTAEATVDPGDTVRIFKVGTTSIVEDESLRGLSVEAAQAQLARSYPEVKNATIRQRTEGAHTVVEFLPQPGRKG